MSADTARGKEMLQLPRWAVVGRSSNAVVGLLKKTLAESGKEVTHVDTSTETAPGVARSLSEVTTPVDVVNLCARPSVGQTILEEMVELGVQNVFVQPGAGTPELRQQAENAGLSWYEGCVLIECNVQDH
eukprot:TRINITY_DN72046_c0_g1_i1.p1 TRINITY_DN72046_c0_g1~~TRINITY_DN72046_c0_g1_i1.p1  ORF type:complete len:140 (+),score=19.84 TRINITY_DN72046_c0_g1_i1:33-422(+)